MSILRWWLCCCALIIVAPIVRGDFVLLHCFWFAVLCDLYSFEVNLLEKRNMFDMPLLGSSCYVAAVVLCTFIRGAIGWSEVCDCDII